MKKGYPVKDFTSRNRITLIKVLYDKYSIEVVEEDSDTLVSLLNELDRLREKHDPNKTH